jgi:PPIC-type peptidyl-prolyl cis-trans isomerase-like protein
MSRWHRQWSKNIGLGVMGLMAACSQREGELTHPEEATPPAVVESLTEVSPKLEKYPRARWRLGSSALLDTAMIWVSHIQIRHDQLENADAPFSLAPWHLGLAPVQRTKGEAFRLAQRIAAEAQAKPEAFPELARKYSEDVTTRDRGGALGGLTVLNFSFPAEVLDAFAVVRPGQVTRVLETEWGYHIAFRHAPPPERKVSGAHIVIGYEGADWLEFIKGSSAQRTRLQAQTLAESLYRDLRSSPERFQEFVAKYSDHPDAARDGDFGTWSNREPSPVAREISLLEELQIGEIAAPIDSAVGFEIVQRIADPDRRPYAMEAIKIGFDPKLSSEVAGSKEWAFQQATDFTERLAADPSRFSALQTQFCCLGTKRWREGQDEGLRLTRALEQMAIGEIAVTPVEHQWSYVIPRRLDPALLPPDPAMQFEVPSPEHMDMVDLIRRSAASGPGWAKLHFDAITQEVLADAPDRAGDREALQALIAALDQNTDAEQRLESYEALLREAYNLLGEQEYARYVAAIYEHFERIYLRPVEP